VNLDHSVVTDDQSWILSTLHIGWQKEVNGVKYLGWQDVDEYDEE